MALQGRRKENNLSLACGHDSFYGCSLQSCNGRCTLGLQFVLKNDEASELQVIFEFYSESYKKCSGILRYLQAAQLAK